MKYFSKKTNQLSFQLLFAVLLCSSFLTFLTSAFQLYFDYQKEINSIRSNIVSIKNSLLPAIKTSVYEFDDRQIRTLLKGALNIDHIKYVEIMDNSNETQKSVENKCVYDVVHRLLLKNGRIKTVNERCETQYDETGKAIRSIGTVHDITIQKKAQAALQKAHDELKTYRDHLESLVETRTKELKDTHKKLIRKEKLGNPWTVDGNYRP
jgi:hypothetical protein